MWPLKTTVLQGIQAPSKSKPLVIFSNAPCRLNTRSGKCPSLQNISGAKSIVELKPGFPTFPNAKGCGLKAIPLRKSEPWFPTQSSRCLPWHYWHTNSCVQPSSIQELSAGSSSTPQFTGAFFFVSFRFWKGEKQVDVLCNTYIRLLWELVGSGTWEEITLDNKAMMSFPYYFRQKDVLECVGAREKARL